MYVSLNEVLVHFTCFSRKNISKSIFGDILLDYICNNKVCSDLIWVSSFRTAMEHGLDAQVSIPGKSKSFFSSL